MPYTIIIPIHNEKNNIPALLEGLKHYTPDHEVLIIDDGSTDGSFTLLSECTYINLIGMEKNSGKGAAIRKGLEQATHNKIIISDGDLELDPKEISILMILDKKKGIQCIFGSRYKTIHPFTSFWDFGNFFLTGLFNMVLKSHNSDALCCSKAFYKDDLNLEKISANGFDIDVEISAALTKKMNEIKSVYLSYSRRSKTEGKKLNYWDGWSILKQILKY